MSNLTYAEEIETILKFYGDGDVHYIEWGTVDDFAAAVKGIRGDWDCDWVYNEDKDYYDFKAWNNNNDDPEAETRLRLIGE